MAEELLGGAVMLPAFICQESFEHLFNRLNITPVFVDIDRDTYRMKIEAAKKKIDQTDAVLVIHPFGLPANMGAWSDLCTDNGVVLLEDCARALGAKHEGRVVGSFGAHAFYSLHKVSPISIGGAVATDRENISEYLANPEYDVQTLYHLLPDDVQKQFSLNYPLDYECRQLDDITRRQFEYFLIEQYESEIHDNQIKANELRTALKPYGFTFQPDVAGRVYFCAPALVPPKVDRDELLNYIYANNQYTPVKVVWPNPWSKSYSVKRFNDRYPHTQEVADRIICFTVRKMDDNDVSFIIDIIDSFFKNDG